MRPTAKLFSNVATEALAIRMIPRYWERGLNGREVIKGPATVIFPGFPRIGVKLFENKGSGIGVLYKVPTTTIVHMSDAFTNATGWNPTSEGLQEFPSRHDLTAAWQPQLPINIVAWLYWRESVTRDGISQFSHNEINAGNGIFSGVIVTDQDVINSLQLQNFRDELKDMGNDDLYFYDSYNLYRVCNSGNIDRSATRFPDNVFSFDDINNPVKKEIMEQRYQQYIHNVAQNYYNTLTHHDIKQELEVAKIYGEVKMVFAIYYDDVMTAIHMLHKSDPDKYSRQVVEATEESKPNTVIKKLEDLPNIEGIKVSRGHDMGNEWHNSGGD